MARKAEHAGSTQPAVSMLGENEVIAAIITPPGEGGIAAVRIAGRRSRSFLSERFEADGLKDGSMPRPFQLYLGTLKGGDRSPIDEVMAVYMPAGRSYTGLDQVEIFCHGGQRVVQLILQEILRLGARVAEPGEFTRLAFLSGRIDLSRAEAVAEIISANTDHSFKAAREHLLGAYSDHIKALRERLVDVIAEVEASIDYPEEEIEPAGKAEQLRILDEVIHSIEKLVESYDGGRIVREGFKVAIAGRPNAGKSSLFNLLLRQERALVTPTAGTTRDYLSEWIDIGGFAVNIVDTAGLRQSGGAIEKAGQASAQKIISEADLVIWIFDLSQRDWKSKLEKDAGGDLGQHKLLLGNKIDICTKGAVDTAGKAGAVCISCTEETGLKDLHEALLTEIRDRMPDLTDGHLVTSSRHAQKLGEALESLQAGRTKIEANETPELTAFDLRQAAGHIDEITGKIYNEEILGRIFSKFCIGK
jgi:tRNA modification GTPase